MKIVLTNDDGIDAPGLRALWSIAGVFAEPIVVAPLEAQSGVGHRVTTHDPLRLVKSDNRHFGVGGTPADCARLALKVIAPEADWLIAGINPGANLGSDIYQSGTVAAAREAAILGCRAIAVSQYISRGGQLDWPATGRLAGRVIEMLMKKDLSAGSYWNVNLPHPLEEVGSVGVRFCDLDTNPHRYHFRKDGDVYLYQGVIHERPRQPGRDVDVCFEGEVAVTRLNV